MFFFLAWHRTLLLSCLRRVFLGQLELCVVVVRSHSACPFAGGARMTLSCPFSYELYAHIFLLSPLLLCPCESAERPPFLSRTFLDNFLFELATHASGAKAAETYSCLCTFIPPTRARVVTRLCISRVYILFFWSLCSFSSILLSVMARVDFPNTNTAEQIYSMFELRNGFYESARNPTPST